MRYLFKNYFFVALVFFALCPLVARGAEIRVATNKVALRVNEQFLADVIIHTAESLNAIEGMLAFPADALAVREIRDGNAVVNFWLEKPHLVSDGVIVFSGITPGGFNGPNNLVFSVIFEAKKSGVTPLELRAIKALLNDGVGTETPLATHDAVVSVAPGDSNIRKEILADVEPPEDFSPVIAQDPTLFDGKRFLVFATQDKKSGMSHYAVREGWWGWFRAAESPYLLKHQSLDKKIFVKAIDNVGNERVAVVNARQYTPWYRQYVVISVLLSLMVLGFLLRKAWSRFAK